MARVALNAAIVLATIVAAMVIWQLCSAVILFLLSLALAEAVRPVVDGLIRRGLPKTLSLVGTYLLGLTVAGLLAAGAVWLLLGEIHAAGEAFTRLYNDVAHHWTGRSWLQRIVARRMPPVDELFASLAGRHGNELLQALAGTAFSILDSGVNLFVIVVLSIYWTLDRRHFERLWLSLVPLALRPAGVDTLCAAQAEAGAYLRSEVMQSLAAGVLLGIGYRLVGFPYPVLLAVAAALAWLVPWVGAVLALLALGILSAPSLMAGTAGTRLAVGLAALLTVGVFLALELLLEPRLFNRRRYDSLLMIFAAIALADTFGLLGLLLGPMLEVAVQVVLERWAKLRAEPPDTRRIDDRLAALQAAVAADGAVPPQLASLVDRLQSLVSRGHEMLTESVSVSEHAGRENSDEVTYLSAPWHRAASRPSAR